MNDKKKKPTKDTIRVERNPLQRISDAICLEVGAFASWSPNKSEKFFLIKRILSLLGVSFVYSKKLHKVQLQEAK